jgi:hypothetical protein
MKRMILTTAVLAPVLLTAAGAPMARLTPIVPATPAALAPAVAVATADDPPPGDLTQRKVSIPPPDWGPAYNGIVVAVAKDSITIVRYGDEHPRRLIACEELAAGGFKRVGADSYTYRLADVQEGDNINIQCRWVHGVEICDAICIRRRPGGRVPPAPGEDPTVMLPWHELTNAYQDREEKGIPLPWGQSEIAPAPRPAMPLIPPAK